MTMIYSITFNPALDISGTVEDLVPNEKSYVEDERHTAGGNGINAAMIASRLGAKVLATGFLGGVHGNEMCDLMGQQRLPHEFIEIEGNTRMNVTVSNKKGHEQTRLSFPGPKVKIKDIQELRTLMARDKEDDLFVLGGSLPPGVRVSHVRQMVKELKARGRKVLVDMPGKYLKEVVPARPDFIKPNLTEFQEFSGKKVQTIKSLLPLVRELNKRVPLVCISSVEGGAILVNEKEAWYGRIPKVKIISTVGAGDSMVGAMSFLLHKDPNASLSELLKLGLAAACATLTEPGLILGSRRSIHEYGPQIFLKEIRA